MADKFTKTTVGFVIQTFDENGKCTHQEFIAGDQSDYDDMEGNVYAEPEDDVYQSYEMVQPNTEIVIHVEGGLIQDVIMPSGLNDLTIVVKDRDTDGVDEDELKEDETGEYMESRWGNGK